MVKIYTITSFFIPGQKWKNRRKQLNPTFNLANLVSFFPIFNTIGNSLVDKFNVLAKEDKDVLAEHGNQINYKTIEDFINRAVLVAACREYILDNETDIYCEAVFISRNYNGNRNQLFRQR